MLHEQWFSVDKLWTFRRIFLRITTVSMTVALLNPRASRVKARICNLWESLPNERDFLQRAAEKNESVGVVYEFLNDNSRNYSKGDSQQ